MTALSARCSSLMTSLPSRWLPGMTRVAPFSSVNSCIAQIDDSSTSTSSGNGKKSKHHWSRCSGCDGEWGPMAMSWVRWSWNDVFFAHKKASAISSTSGCATNCCELTDRASSAPVRVVWNPENASEPCGVAAMNGCISCRTASHTSASTRRSMMTTPASRRPATMCSSGASR